MFGGKSPLPISRDGVDLATSAEQPVVDVDEAHALDSLAGGVFVGRQREMGDLKAALEDTLSGRGRLVTLVGEPGIGKSRTAKELTTYAGLRGAHYHTKHGPRCVRGTVAFMVQTDKLFRPG